MNSNKSSISSQQVVFASVLLLNLYMLQSFLLPLIVGGLFAVVLYPLHARLLMRKWKSYWSATLITGLFLLVFLIPLAILIFLGTKAALDLIQAAPWNHFEGSQYEVFNQMAEEWGLNSILERFNEWFTVTREQLQQFVVSVVQRGAQTVGGLLQNLLTQIPEFFISTVIIVLTLYYCLVDGRRVVDFFRRYSIFSETHTELLIDTVGATCHSVIVASILSGIVQSILITVVCLIIGQNNVALITMIAFLCSFFPLFGTTPVSTFLFLSQLFAGSTFGVIMVLVFAILVGLSDNLVRPLVLSGGTNIHPLLAFVSAFGALAAIGFYGLFLGPICMGLLVAMIPFIFKSHPVATVSTEQDLSGMEKHQ